MSERAPVECGGCGWTGKRAIGNVAFCPKCGSIAAFQIPRTPPDSGK